MNTFVYGNDETFHDSTALDVETDADGNVVSVWFRCRMLPFRQTRVSERRSDEMQAAMDTDVRNTKLHAVTLSEG